MFLLVIAHKCCADWLGRRFATDISMGGEHARIALPFYNGADDLPAGRVGGIRDHMMKLQVRLHLGLLDLSRICAAPSARLSHLSLESDRAFPAQC